MSESQSKPQQNGQTYQAWQVSEQDGQYRGREITLNTADLPAGDVLIRVSHSSLNYKHPVLMPRVKWLS